MDKNVCRDQSLKKQIGIVVRTFRAQFSLNQVFMASKLGLYPPAYANIEQGRSDINTERLDSIAKLFGVKAYQIVVLAEEIRHNDSNDGLADAVRGIVRLAGKKLQIKELTCEDEYLLSMDQSVRGSVSL